MRNPLVLGLCLAVLFPARAAFADDDSSNLKVDIVVDMTESGKRVTRPTPSNPAYYFPITKGFTPGGAIMSSESTPPAVPQVQRMIAVALAQQGYRFCNRAHPPTILLMFWWGYKAPVTIDNGGYIANGGSLGGGANGAASINAAFRSGTIPTNSVLNQDEMNELVYGSDYESGFGDTEKNLMSARMERLKIASKVPRYYVMISALDFQKAMKKGHDGKPIMDVLWTARVSTELQGHTLEEVLPTLITDVAPALGRKTDGPQWTESPLVPMGQVIVGNPVLKSSVPASTVAPKSSP